MSVLKILACQISIPATSTVERRDNHLKQTSAKADKWLTENPADILVLPELSSLDYSTDTFTNLESVAEEDNGSSYRTWSEVAKSHNCWVLYGYARRCNHGALPAYSIATGVIKPDGKLDGVYEKLHLAQFGASEEKDYFNVAGSQLLVFECKGFKLAPITCYDIRFAELARALVLQHGVDCILHTGAYARDPSFDSWHAFVKTRAMENQIYVLSLNRAGDFFGQSVFMPPWVDDTVHPTLFDETKEQSLLVTLERKALNYARDEFHFLDDRLSSYDLPLFQHEPT